jgi:hypothetical protein
MWIQRKNTQEVCIRKKKRNKKKKEVEKHRVYKHRIQSHDAHRHCTLLRKRRCAIISNMEITNMKRWENIELRKSLIWRKMITKRLPVRSPKINKKTLCDCKYAVRMQRILKSQRQRDLKLLEEKIFTRV